LTEAAEMERAESVLSEAVERGRATGERAVTAYGAVARLNLRLFTTPQKSYEESSLEVEEAIRVFEEVGDAAGTARALGVRGMFRLWQGGTEAAIKDLGRAAQYARQVDDRPHEADILRYVLVAILFGPTPVEDALERVEEIRSRTGTNRTLEVTLLRTRGQLEAMQGNFDSARNLIAQGKALAEELGLVWMLVGGIPIQAAYIELLAGDASAAERELRPAWEALEQLGSWGDFVAFAYRLADALFLQRRDDEALRLTELAEGRASRQDVETAIGWRRVRAKVLARRGEPAEGERLAREAIALAARTDYLHYHAQAVADLAEVLRLSGRSKESAAVAKEAIRLYEKKGNIVAARALRGFLAELAGV
jgi:tetratricopeptide (TPR) repeat protein